MRGELSRLRGAEEEARSKSNQVSSLQEELQKLRKELSATQQEKKTIEDWAQTYRDEMEKVSQPAGPGGPPHVPLCRPGSNAQREQHGHFQQFYRPIQSHFCCFCEI